MTKNSLISHLPENFQHFLCTMKEEGIRRNIPNISWDTAEFLVDTVREKQPKNILEIGPANGFSTMMLHLACEAEVTSIECSRHAFEELRHNLSTFVSYETHRDESVYSGSPANFSPKVTSDICEERIGNSVVYYGDACEILPAFSEGMKELTTTQPISTLRDIPQKRFDVVFIDGAFRMTRRFFDLSRQPLSPGGIIIVDDAIKYRWKMDGFHEYLESIGVRYELIQTDADDGVMIIRELPTT